MGAGPGAQRKNADGHKEKPLGEWRRSGAPPPPSIARSPSHAAPPSPSPRREGPRVVEKRVVAYCAGPSGSRGSRTAG